MISIAHLEDFFKSKRILQLIESRDELTHPKHL